MVALTIIMLVCGLLPTGLFFWNAFLYRSPREPFRPISEGVSVLIPARNEEKNIRAAVQSVLANSGIPLEVIVLDDASEDNTRQILQELRSNDPRVRVLESEALPPGWNGKPHACHLLSHAASYPYLVFLDADVRLTEDALPRLVGFLETSGADLISGIPRQFTGTFMERLLIPLIHFILLCYLPLWGMRRSRGEAFGAGCGQVFVVKRKSYEAIGGHKNVALNFHDGLHLPRAFRRAGLRTDLVDLTDVVTCRMYEENRQVWPGLAKTAVEGMAAPKVIGWFTALLLFGQILPFLVLAANIFVELPSRLSEAAIISAAAVLAVRLYSAVRFKQSWLGVLLHPVAVSMFLLVNWWALMQHFLGKPIAWKGRANQSQVITESKLPNRTFPRTSSEILRVLLLGFALLTMSFPVEAAQSLRMAEISLSDQHGTLRLIRFPTGKPVIVTLADREGYKRMPEWISVIKAGMAGRAEVIGVADLQKVPGLLRGMVRKRFVKDLESPVLMDWEGQLARGLKAEQGAPNVYLFDQDGTLQWHSSGPATDERARELLAALGQLTVARAGAPSIQ